MNDKWHEEIQRCMTGDAAPEEIVALQEALKADAELRSLYLDYLNLDLALETAAAADAMAKSVAAFQERKAVKLSVWAKFSLSAVPLGAAAAVAIIFLPAQKQVRAPQPSDSEQVAQIIFQRQFPDSL